MTVTYAEALGKHNIALPDELIADVEVPVISGAQAQGDVGIFPVAPGTAMRTMEPVPAAGVIVVKGENTHILDAYAGTVLWARAPERQGGVTLGYLFVGDGGVATLTHTDEHTTNGIGAGTYRVTGKREQADEIRRVAD